MGFVVFLDLEILNNYDGGATLHMKILKKPTKVLVNNSKIDICILNILYIEFSCLFTRVIGQESIKFVCIALFY